MKKNTKNTELSLKDAKLSPKDDSGILFQQKDLSSLLRRITLKNGASYCLDCLHSFRTKSKLESHEKVCKNKYFCNVMMPSEDTKILEFNQYLINLKNLIKHHLLFVLILNV